MSRKPSSASKTTPHASGGEGQTPLAAMLFGWTAAPWTANFFLLVVGVCALVLLAADFLIHRHAYTGTEFSLTKTFHGLYGFGAFSLVVLTGWPLGKLLRRKIGYYEPGEPTPPAEDHEGEAH